MMRKIIIGLITVAFVGLMFLGYALLMDTAPIQTPSVVDVQNISMPQSQGTGPGTADTDIRAAKDARYIILDPVTKKKTRIFGFETLLNPGMETSRWQVENPYLIFYETNYKCRIDSDKGIFQTSGANEIPKDARLSGNVVIHLTPEAGSRMSETFIKMDDLAFSSERSEFATDGPVSIESDQVKLKGYGLILLFDTATGRIDYLHIRDLETLRILNIPENQNTATMQSREPSDKRKPVETASPQASEVSPPIAGDASDSSEKTASSSDFYECILDKDVEIAYGDEIIINGVDQVNIQNILFSGLNDNGETGGGLTDPDVPKIEKSKRTKRPSNHSDEVVRSADAATEIIVHCDGGIILKPKQAQEDLMETAGSDSVVNSEPPSDSPAPIFANTVSEGTWQISSNPDEPSPAKFEAWKIDYDLQTGTGVAHGPVRFTFLQPADSTTTTTTTSFPWKPVMVTADEDARFISNALGAITKIVFDKNVLAARRSQQPEFTQLDQFHGDKLSIFLDKNQDGATDVSGVHMTDGKVYAQSWRFKDEQTLLKVRLTCSEIAYDRTNDKIAAKGPNGQIQFDNSHVSGTATTETKAGVDMSKPCYVYADGFDSIQWNLAEEKIITDGQQDQLRIAYVPLLNGAPEKYIYVDSIQFTLSFMTDPAGKTGLKRIFTDQGIVYREQNPDHTLIHKIIGGTLEYDVADTSSWVKIQGTKAQPCYMDGVRMPFIYIHPASGQVETSLSNIPGVLPVP